MNMKRECEYEWSDTRGAALHFHLNNRFLLSQIYCFITMSLRMFSYSVNIGHNFSQFHDKCSLKKLCFIRIEPAYESIVSVLFKETVSSPKHEKI